MSYAVMVVCDRELATGFGLTGVQAFGVDEPAEAQATLLRLLRTRRMGLVLVAREIMETAGRLRRQLSESRMPIFVELPIQESGPEEEDLDRARAYVSRMAQQAIGQKINIDT